MKKDGTRFKKITSQMRGASFPLVAMLAAILPGGCSPSSPSPRDPQRAITMEEAMEAPDRVRNLDLFYRKLPAFPRDILKLANLEHLTLRTCTIGNLPAEVATLSKLMSLDMGQTSLTNLTPAVASLRCLTKLWLNDNALTSLPPELGTLKQLAYLNLDRNQLTSLPDSTGAMTSLRWLRLNDNKLTALPSDLSGLAQNLETLYLIGNPIPDEERDRIRNALPKCKVVFQ